MIRYFALRCYSNPTSTQYSDLAYSSTPNKILQYARSAILEYVGKSTRLLWPKYQRIHAGVLPHGKNVGKGDL